MSAAFKEWKSVCDSLERGEQTIILRKGGIAEGKKGFLWQHQDFYLFPTVFHNHREQLKAQPNTADSSFEKRDDEKIEIRLAAKVIWSADINTIEIAKKLSPFHIWKDEVIDQRFDYSENKGIRLALLRIYRLANPWILEDRASFGGCRSWLDFPEAGPDNQIAAPIINDVDFANQKAKLEDLLNEAGISITEFDQ